MSLFIPTYFAFTYLLTLFFGYLQTPASLPYTQSDTSKSEIFSILAIATIPQPFRFCISDSGKWSFIH